MSMSLPRTRSRSSSDSFSVPVSSYQVNGVTTSSRDGIAQTATTESMTDHTYSGFYNSMRSGSVVMMPMNSSKSILGYPQPCQAKKVTKVTYKEGYQHLTDTTAVSVYGTRIFADANMLPRDVSDEMDQVALATYGTATQSISQILVTFAEMRKTIDLIVGAKKRFMKRFVDLFYKDRRNLKRVMDSTASTWLEARYGWRPLLYDIDSYAKALADAKYQLRKLQRASYVLDLGTISDSGTRSRREHYANWPYDYHNRRSDTIRGVILFKTNPNIIDEWDKRFGITSLLSTIWELVPFSFVVDRFINIGDFLTFVDNYDLISTVGSCVTHRASGVNIATWQGTSTISADSFVNNYKYTQTSKVSHTSLGSGSLNYLWTKKRIVNIPIPRTPVVDVNIDLPFGLDLLAIARNLAKR